jgi:thiol-disulfide isomerase/thioredoxin
MKKFLLIVCVLAGVSTLLRMWGSNPHFMTAASTLRVERLAPDGTVLREDFDPRQARYLAVYHGASWCGPCQQFSLRLSEFYHLADKSKGRFQLLMVNWDRSEPEMVAYMRQHRMEFPAVGRGEAGGWGASTGDGIPNLVIIDTATGDVVSSSYRGSDYVGCDRPLGVLLGIIAKGHP